MAPNSKLPRTLVGLKIARNADGMHILNHLTYVWGLKVLLEEASWSDFAFVRMKLVCLSHSRLDCMFTIFQLTHVTKDYFQEEHCIVFQRPTS